MSAVKALKLNLFLEFEERVAHLSEKISMQLKPLGCQVYEEAGVLKQSLKNNLNICGQIEPAIESLIVLSDFQQNHNPREKFHKLQNSSERLLEDVEKFLARFVGQIKIESKEWKDLITISFPKDSDFVIETCQLFPKKLSIYRSVESTKSLLNKPDAYAIGKKAREEDSASNRLPRASIPILNAIEVFMRNSPLIEGNNELLRSSKGSALKNFGSQKTLKNSFLNKIEDLNDPLNILKESQVFANFQTFNRNENANPGFHSQIPKEPEAKHISAMDDVSEVDQHRQDSIVLQTPNFSSYLLDCSSQFKDNESPQKKLSRHLEDLSELQFRKTNLMNEYFNLRGHKTDQKSQLAKTHSQDCLETANSDRRSHGIECFRAICISDLAKIAETDFFVPQVDAESTSNVRSSEANLESLEAENTEFFELTSKIRLNKSKTLDISGLSELKRPRRQRHRSDQDHLSRWKADPHT